MGKKLYLKGDRCYSERCAFERRATVPGRTRRRNKPTGYGIHLKEKQIARTLYGISERQFKRLFIKAKGMKGVIGTELIRLLERRLDNVIYRLNLASSRNTARQLVNHRHFWVNGRVVDLPSYIVRASDEITVKPESRNEKYFKEVKDQIQPLKVDHWLKLDIENLTALVARYPEDSELETLFNPQLIVEYYSRLV